MAALTWDAAGEKIFEGGVYSTALFVMKDIITNNGATGDDIYEKGKAWNGVTGITENREGGEPQDQYADNIKYISLLSPETFGLTIEAFTYPDEWAACDGSGVMMSTGQTPAAIAGLTVGQQRRKAFALAYKTKIGNDIKDFDYGYKLHIVYNLKASPSERAYETINDSPEGMTMSWEATGTPIEISGQTGLNRTCVVEIDSTKVATAANLVTLEEVLFGKGSTAGTNDPTMLLPHEVAAYISTGAAPV